VADQWSKASVSILINDSQFTDISLHTSEVHWIESPNLFADKLQAGEAQKNSMIACPQRNDEWRGFSTSDLFQFQQKAGKSNPGFLNENDPEKANTVL